MTPEQKRRLETAVGFLAGAIACLHALADRAVYWPPDVVWAGLSPPQHLEFGGGLALIMVTLVISVVRRRRRH
jgi:hypothetical protein